MTDRPFTEIAVEAERLINRGVMLFQKFTCEECGQRLTIEEPNTFYRKASCDKCGHVTDIEAKGCGFLAVGGATEMLEEFDLSKKKN